MDAFKSNIYRCKTYCSLFIYTISYQTILLSWPSGINKQHSLQVEPPLLPCRAIAETPRNGFQGNSGRTFTLPRCKLC